MLATDTDFHWGSLGGWWSLANGVLAYSRHPGVKTGVDHYDLQSLNIYLHIPFQYYSCLDTRSGWLIPLGLVIADCSWDV